MTPIIKSYSRYTCHTLASPFLRIPLPFSNFSIPLFLGIFGKINAPLLKKRGVELCFVILNKSNFAVLDYIHICWS